MKDEGKFVLDITLRDVVEDGWKEFAHAIGIDRADFGHEQRREMKKAFLAGMSFMFGVMNRVVTDCSEKGLEEVVAGRIVKAIVDRVKELAHQLATDQIAEMMEQAGQNGRKPN